MWDLLKLASGATLSRVCAAFAVYGAPVKQWQKPAACADLFESGTYRTAELVAAYKSEWKKNLKGSPNAWPENLQLDFTTDFLGGFDVEVLGVAWEVRLVEVIPGGVWTWLEDG
jgi:hypothetical protein